MEMILQVNAFAFVESVEVDGQVSQVSIKLGQGNSFLDSIPYGGRPLT